MSWAIPKNYTTITPYLAPDPKASFEFFAAAFESVDSRRSPLPDGSIFNIVARVGDSMVMVVQGRPYHDLRPSALYMYVEDVDAAYGTALAAGASSLMEPAELKGGRA